MTVGLPETEPPKRSFEAACVDLEQAVLGTLLMNNEAYGYYCQAGLTAEHFGEQLHRRIYELAAFELDGGHVVSPLTIRTRLPDQAITPNCTSGQYLARLAANGMPLMCAEDFAHRLVDWSRRRKMVERAREFIDRAENENVDSAPVAASELLTDLQTIAAEGGDDDTRREPGASAAALIERAKLIMSGDATRPGVSTGFTDLDRDTGGYEPGTLWIVGARPGVGKTVFMVASSRRVAKKGAGVLDFSLEVPEDQITARFLADLAYRHQKPIQFGRILRGDIDDDELWCIEDAQKRLAALPLRMDVASRLTMAEITAKVRQQKEIMARAGTPLAVVFIDYLKFIKASDRYKGQRVYEVGEISAGLKALAKNEGLCVVLLAQLNRALEARDDKRPTLADLRESGDLEADADVVAFLHREAYHIEKSAKYRAGDPDENQRFVDMKNSAEIILGKNRAGPTSKIDLWCDVAASTMATLDRHYGSQG